MPPPTFFIWIFSTRGNWSKPIWESKKHTRPPWKWKTSDLGHFRLKMTQKCITFEQKLRFTKFKALNWSEFHQKLEFPSTISIFGELRPPSDRTDVETIYTHDLAEKCPIRTKNSKDSTIQKFIFFWPRPPYHYPLWAVHFAPEDTNFSKELYI